MFYLGVSSYIKKLVCIHEPDFTNAIFSHKSQVWQFSLWQTIYGGWETAKASPHFCLIEDGYDKVRIGEYFGLSKKQITNLTNPSKKSPCSITGGWIGKIII